MQRLNRLDLREVVNEILRLASGGNSGRALPKDFPPVSTAVSHFIRWAKDRTWLKSNFALVMTSREREGREVSPSAGVSDSR